MASRGIIWRLLSKKEVSGVNTYIMYFYYGKEKYIVVGRMTEDTIRDIVIDYKNIVLNYQEKK